MTDQHDPSEVQSSTLIRYSEILRQQVLDSTTLEPLGRVDTLWMYPQVNRVLGLICKPGLFGSTRLVLKLPQVQSVQTQVLVEGSVEETVTNKVDQLESLIGSSVWSDGGEQVGHITDCLFDLKSGVIIRYLLVPDRQMPSVVARLTEGTYLLSPKQIKSFSRQRVLIADQTVQDLRLYSEGLRLKLSQLSATLQQDYWQGATEEWESFSSHLQSVASQAKETLLTLAEKAKATAQNLSQTLSQTVAEQMERLTDEESDSPLPWPKGASMGEQTTTSQETDPQPDVIQTQGTNGDVFDIEDWQLGTDSESEHSRDEWDGPDPWDDWEEDSPRPPSSSSPTGGDSMDPISPATTQDRVATQPTVQRSEPGPVDQTTADDSVTPQKKTTSDRVSDLDEDVDDPWIT